MRKLLIIDDEANIRYSISQVFAEADDVQVFDAERAAEGLQLAAQEMPQVVLLDIRLEGASGFDVFQKLRRADPRCQVVFITGHGTADMAIEAMKLGAYDYLVKPLDADRLRHIVDQAFTIGDLMRVPAFVDDGQGAAAMPDRLIGNSPAMQAICKQIGRVASHNDTVLIYGEVGTGIELVARALYHHSQRNHAPFQVLNCAATTASLLECELFGNERAPFTGSNYRRIGKVEQCQGGTLFIDQIGELSFELQTKLVRLLQYREFERVGGAESLSSDVRIIAGTNQDLDALIESGRFRTDLYFRLRDVTLHLPPLRDRREDIPELAHYFLFRISHQLGTVVQSISEEALELLTIYTWPGNVRELQSVIRHALTVSLGPTLLAEDLPDKFHDPREIMVGRIADDRSTVDVNWLALQEVVEDGLRSGSTGLYRTALEQFDRMLLSRALQHTSGNQVQSAHLLGLSRPTLRAKLRALKLLVRKAISNVPEDK